MAQKDYPELEGKVIVWCYPDRPEIEEAGIVIGCNFDIGITIVNKLNRSDDLMCVNGPMAAGHNREQSDTYPARFYSAVRGIKNGRVEAAMNRKIRFKGGYSFKGAEMAPCPFR